MVSRKGGVLDILENSYYSRGRLGGCKRYREKAGM